MKRSESIANIGKALAAAQGMMGPLTRGRVNPFYKSKYAELSDVFAVIKKPFAENGLAYSQSTVDAPEGYVSILTLLLHESGEWLESVTTMPVTKNDPQGYGSASTYARRYGLQAMCGLSAEDDDDGNAASRVSIREVQEKHLQPENLESKSEMKSTPEKAPENPPTTDLPWVEGVFQGGIVGDKDKKIPHKIGIKTKNGEHELSFFGRPPCLKETEDWSTLVGKMCRFKASVTKKGDVTYKNLLELEFIANAF